MVLHLNVVVAGAKLMSQSFEERLYQWLWRIGSDVIQGQNTEACAKAIVCIKVCWVIHSCVHWGVHWGAWDAAVLYIGMAMGQGQVQVGFLHTGPDPRVWTRNSDPARLLIGFFSQGPNPLCRAPQPKSWPNQKKKIWMKPKFIFVSPISV